MVHRLRGVGWAAGRSWPDKCSEKCPSEGPLLLSYLVLLGRRGQDQDPTLQLLTGGSV